MKRRDAGFTLVEMLVVIAILGFVLAGTSEMFISLLRTHRQQSRITETNIEGIVGLELLRQDLEKAGYGLPWNWNMVGFTYNEAAGNPNGLNDAPSSPPRGIVSANNVELNGSDYLVVKAANVATNKACSKWAFLLETTLHTSPWPVPSENLDPTDRVIIIAPSPLLNPRALIASGVSFGSADTYADKVETKVVYGIDTGPIRMPFNRADYFVMRPSSSDMPKRCAPGTGILYKAVVNQADGGFSYMPLLDCVADIQVIFRWTNNKGALSTINVYEDVSGLPGGASAIRSQVNEVRVFILAHEGQRDPAYQHPVSSVNLGDNGIVKNFDLTTTGSGWQNYRWKVYTLVVRLNNLNW